MSDHPGHGRIVCSCGNTIIQCRCLDNDRILETRPHPACAMEPPAPTAPAPPPEPPARPNLFLLPPPAPEEEKPAFVNQNVVTVLEQALARAKSGEIRSFVLIASGPELMTGSVWVIPKGGMWSHVVLGELVRAQAGIVARLDEFVPVPPAPPEKEPS